MLKMVWRENTSEFPLVFSLGHSITCISLILENLISATSKEIIFKITNDFSSMMSN